MTDILVRNVDPDILDRLKKRARANGRSLQQELHHIIWLAAGGNVESALELGKRMRARIRKHFPNQTDSVKLIREDRDR